MKELEKRIISALEDDGIRTTGDSSFADIKLFMEMHGYIDGDGWWIKK